MIDIEIETQLDRDNMRWDHIMERWWPHPSQSIYIVGGSGVGKSTFIREYLDQVVMKQGLGFAYLDPHGEAEKVLGMIHRKRFRDVVWLDASEGNVALNLVDYAPGRSVAHMFDAFQSTYHFKDDAQRLLKFALVVHSYVEGTHIGDVLKMLQDDIYLRRVVAECKDEYAHNYYAKEYQTLRATPRLLADATNPVKGAIEDLLGEAPLKKMFCVPESKIHLEEIMDKGMILLCSIPNYLGEKNVRLVGNLILSLIRSAGFRPERIDVAPPFPVVVEEFPVFASAKLLSSGVSELRKFRVPLILPHQYAGQSEEVVQAAVASADVKLCWEPSGWVLKEKFKDFDFGEMNSKAAARGYHNAVAIIDGRREIDGYTRLPRVLSDYERQKRYCDPEALKRHCKMWYGYEPEVQPGLPF